jgi:hypothetical protein
MRTLVLCLIQLLFLAPFAHAQSITRAVEDFHMLGLWAVDCHRQPAPRNEHATFTKANADEVQLVNDFGVDYDNMVYRIVAAQRIGNDRVSLRQVLATDGKVVLDVVLWKVNDKLRTWSSRVSDGSALVVDGVVSSTNGHKTPWIGRCKERWVAQP